MWFWFAFFWIAITVSVVSFAYARTLTLKSLKGGLMSEIVPLAFFMVLFNYLFGLIFLSESLRLIPIIGLIFFFVRNNNRCSSPSFRSKKTRSIFCPDFWLVIIWR